MVAALSEGRPKYVGHAELLAVAGRTGRELADRFLELADQDAAAYAEFSAARKLPRDNGDQRVARDVAVRAAARRAAEVPLECVEACVRVVSTAEALAGRSNANAASDLNVASLLGEGGGANVLVNLPAIGDDEFAALATSRVDELLHEITRLTELTRAVVLSGEPREPLGLASPTRG